MDVQRIVGRFGRRLLRCMLGAMFALGPGTVSAQQNPCGDFQDPDCQNQVQAGINYSGWETKSWAYYCGGDHPVYRDGSDSIDFGNTCFTVAENPVAENKNFDGSFTNWCIGDQSLVVVLACFFFKVQLPDYP